MPDSTLSNDYTDLAKELAFYFGFPLDLSFTDKQKFVVESVMKGGLNQFYIPAPQNGVNYQWTFLRPVWTLPLTESVGNHDLPPEWGGFEGPMTIGADSATNYWTVLTEVGSQHIESMRATSSTATTGQPTCWAHRPKVVQQTHGQRHELLFYPTPDASYTVRAEMFVLADKISIQNPYAYGGAAHADTIKASMLAKAELEKDGVAGPLNAAWQERLAASIAHDSRLRPNLVGRYGDRSGRKEWRGERGVTLTVSVNGTMTEM